MILVPGLWLDASSWEAVIPALRAAGHDPLPLTMPGVGAPAIESADVGIDDWVDAVVGAVDAAEGDIALVGHSGGGNVAWGAADRRPGRVSAVVFVDSAPPPPGAMISEFGTVDGVIPFPGWDAFDAAETADLDPATRARVAEQAKSVPARVPTDPIELGDDRRFGVPVTVLSGAYDGDSFTRVLENWPAFAKEFRAIATRRVVRLDSGHWPQFSQPERLGARLVDALGGQHPR